MKDKDMKDKNRLSVIEKNVLDTIQDFCLIRKGEKVLIALSGGADSVFLAYLLCAYSKQLNISIAVCHVNHHLRGEESKRDQEFSEAYAKKLGLSFFLKDVDVNAYSCERKLSIETAAREVRYRALDEVFQEGGFDKIATAHHLDDLSETFFFRILKGAGITSLAAIPIQRGPIIRPILFVSRSEIEFYLSEKSISYVEDSSNQDERHDRNYLRKNIIPLLANRFPAFREKIAELYKTIFLEEEVWDGLLEPLWSKCEIRENQLIVNKAIFSQGKPIHQALTRRFFRQVIQSFLDRSFYPNGKMLDKVISFTNRRKGNKTIFKNPFFRILSSYELFIFEKDYKKFPNPSKYVKLRDSLKFYAGREFALFSGFSPEIFPGPDFCVFNGEGLEGIFARGKEAGDRIQIKDGRSKKLKHFFIDRKFSVIQREEAVVFEAVGTEKTGESGKIIAVFVPGFGFRVSRDFYVLKNQKADVWRLEPTPNPSTGG